MNTGQTGYVYRYSTAFTDPDNNYKAMKILPNDTVNFKGATSGAWLTVLTAPAVETTTKVTIKGVDIFGNNITQFSQFTVIPRLVGDVYPASVFEFQYSVGAAALQAYVTT